MNHKERKGHRGPLDRSSGLRAAAIALVPLVIFVSVVVDSVFVPFVVMNA